jgi:hypothetical protein
MDLDDSYADPGVRDNYAHMTGPNGSRRSPHRPDGFASDGHGPPQIQPPPMIGWIPSAAEQAHEGPPTVHDPEGTLVEETEPQVITPPIESDNPLRSNVYHTRQPDYEPNAKHHRRRTPAQEYAREVSIPWWHPLR